MVRERSASGGRGASRGIAGIVAFLVVIWLVIGVLAAYQRHYFGGSQKPSCSKVTTVLVTAIAGPLNYVGANPKIKCSTPQPSK
jgi:hypothetical protein